MERETILANAERLFLNKEYEDAMKVYAIALSIEPDNIDAQVGVLLCDIGLEFPEEAQVLYYYYESKKDSSKNPKEMIEQLVTSFEAQNNYIDIFKIIETDELFSEGIEYEDFLSLIESKENFKEAFEDAIFSTKVIISQKWQFVDFIKKLTENGYYSVALEYLETHAPLYGNDQDILTLYSLLPKGKV
jgi:tetratricopeptide (TPR) repeat protein